MNEVVIVAVITVLGNLIISFLTNSKTQTLLTYRIDELTKKVEKHNNTIERTYKLESDLQTAFVKIDNLYEEVEEIKHEKRSN